MELDDFKKEEFGNTPRRRPDFTPESFTEAVKSKLKEQRKLSVLWITILVSLSVIYLSKVNSDLPESLGFGITASGFILGALYIHFRYKIHTSLYSLPTAEFLKQSERKLIYMSLSDLLIVVPLLGILGTGGGLIFIARLLHYTDNFYLLLFIWIIFFIALCIFGFYAGRKDWQKKHGRLLKDISEMKASLNDSVQST